MMLDVLDRENLFKLGGDLDPAWPHVTLGNATIGGEAEWRAALLGCPPLVIAERHELVRQCTPHLLAATPGARARLEAGREAEPRAAGPPELVEAELRANLRFHGDGALLPAAVRAFGLLPPVVRTVLVDEVAVVTVGRSSAGWTSSARFLDRDNDAPERIVVVSGAMEDGAVVAVLLHELGHCWIADRPHSYSRALTEQQEAAVLDMARREGWGADAIIAKSERLADALALAWTLS